MKICMNSYCRRELEVLNRIYQQLINNQNDAKPLTVRKPEIEVVKEVKDHLIILNN